MWDLPEAEDLHEDTAYGRLTDSGPMPVEQVAVPVHADTVRAFAAVPRWEHPQGSKAAAVAGHIREAGRMLPKDERPRDLRCFAIGAPGRAERIEARVRELLGDVAGGKTSPYYARGFSLSGSLISDRSRGLSWSEEMETTQTTPTAAPGKILEALPVDLAASAAWVRKRVWHSWRAQLGRSEVLLPSVGPEAVSESPTGSPWDDLHRTIATALRRGPHRRCSSS